MPAKTVVRPDWGWQNDAQCWGEPLVLFFGPDGERQPERDRREARAKAICAQCPVRAECLNYALSRPEKYGTYGGLNEDERASERRRRMRRGNREIKPQPGVVDPERDLMLLRESDKFIAAGETLKGSALLLGMAEATLRNARTRAQSLLAEVS